MKPILILWVLLLPGTARAQDELDGALEQLAGSLGEDGPSAKLAELLRAPAGRQAVRERIDFLLEARTGRIERDAIGHYEDHLFIRDPNGFLHARPERADDLRRMAVEVGRAPGAMAGFNRRLDGLVARIGKAAEVDQRARHYWSDPEFRRAFFHTRIDELREMDDADLVSEHLTSHVEPRPEGGLRLTDASRQVVIDVMAFLRGRVAAARACEKAWLKLALQEPDEGVRKRSADTQAALFILGRIVRQAQDGAEAPTGTIGDVENSEEKSLALAVPVADLVRDAEGGRAFGERLGPALDRMAEGLARGEEAEKDLAGFLKDGATRTILVEHLYEIRRAEAARQEKVLGEILQDGFEGTGDLIWVKKGRYADDQGGESLEAFEGEHRRVIEGFRERRRGWDLIAERCADPALARLFESRAGTFVLERRQREEIERMIAAVRRDGLKTFIGLTLEKKGGAYAVLPRRAAGIDELARRAAEIRKEQDSGK